MPRAPLYKEVKEKLVAALAGGEWKAGDKVPVEGELAQRYGVGVATIRTAVGELEAAGILARRQGKGTFVADHSSERTIDRFFNLVRTDGARLIPSRALVSLRRVRATPQEQAALQLARYPGVPSVFRIRTTISVEDRCIGVSDVSVPATLFPGLNRTGIIDGSVALYALYQKNYNVNVVSVSADLTAESAPVDVAVLLGTTVGVPLLRIDRMALTYNAVPVESRVSWVRTRDYKFHVSQNQTV